MKNLGLAGAVALCGIGLILIGLGSFRTQTVYAAPAVAASAAVQDKSEPTIVWMDQSTSSPEGVFQEGTASLWRMWSDGKIEVRSIRMASVYGVTCSSNSILDQVDCGTAGVIPFDTGWIELPAPPGGEGYACRSDVNGDRRVDGVDLATLLSQWGDGVSCDPQPSYDCLQLSDLNS